MLVQLQFGKELFILFLYERTLVAFSVQWTGYEEFLLVRTRCMKIRLYIRTSYKLTLMYVPLSMHLQETRRQASVEQKTKDVNKQFKKRRALVMPREKKRGRTSQRRREYAAG